MFRRARSQLSYANVMATVAVFVALGGSAYAAASLPRNSVGPRQLKKNAVTAPKVKDGSLLLADFKAGQVPRGPQGAPGPQGAQGVQGPKGDAAATSLVTRYAETTDANGGNNSAQIDCAPNERAVGGSVGLSSGNSTNMFYFQPGGQPVPDGQGTTPTGWRVSYFYSVATSNTVRVSVICISP